MGLIFEWWVTELVAVFATVFMILYATFKVNYTYWKRKGLPYMEPSFPLGNGWDVMLMRKCPGEDMKDVYLQAEGKDVVGIFSINNPLLVVRDPELIKTIIVKDFNYFPDRGIHVDEQTDHLMKNLFFLGGSQWRSLRQKVTPTFTSGKMRAMFGIVRDCARTLAKVTPADSIVEVRELIARYTTDVIASCAFGIDVDSLHNPEAEFRQWGRRFLKPSFHTYLTQALGFSNPKLRKLLPIAFTPKDITEYFTRVVNDTVTHREKTGVIRKDLMQLLIQLKNNGFVDDSFVVNVSKGAERESNTLTIKELAAQAWVFFVAGFETSAATVSFCLYEISKHRDVQRRLQEEIDDILKKKNGEITYESVMSEMPYLEKVVSETLRIYPPVPVLNRDVVRDYKLPGYDCILEKGTKILIPVMGLHHDRKYFHNADRFDPEHFSEEQKATRHPFSYLPFGDGPRVCIGMRFGLMQVKTALVNLLSKFNFLPVGDTSKPLRLAPNNILLTPTGGIDLHVQRRQVSA